MPVLLFGRMLSTLAQTGNPYRKLSPSPRRRKVNRVRWLQGTIPMNRHTARRVLLQPTFPSAVEQRRKRDAAHAVLSYGCAFFCFPAPEIRAFISHFFLESIF